MREFVKSLQADVLLISQNEYWPNMISECLALDIPIYFISSYITTGHWWLNPFALSVTKQLKEVNHIFLQDQLSYQLLKEKGFTNISHVGNTRIDQVIENTTTNKTYPQIEEFISSGQRIILAGSTLPKDERLLFQLFAQTKQLKLIIVPHEPQQFEINQLPSLIREEVCYISKFSEADKHKSILIFDSIGDLKYLYKYCDISYVGGGFDQGVHSVLEAAVFHRPIITGPNIQKFEDARNLHEMGILNTVESISELVKKIAQLKGGLTEEQGQNLSKYIAINQGATQQMLDQIRF